MGSDQKRAFLAVALSGLVLVLWQMYFVPQPVPVSKTESAAQTKTINKDESGFAAIPAVEDTSSSDSSKIINPEALLTEHTLSDAGHRFIFRNDLSIRNILNHKAVFDFQSIAGEIDPFHIELMTTSGSEKLFFTFAESADPRVLNGFNQTYGVTFNAVLNEEGKLNFHLHSERPYRYRFLFHSKAEKLENNQIRQFVLYTNEVLREAVGDSDAGDGMIKWFGVDFNFHLFAFVFNDKTRATYDISKAGDLKVEMLDPVADFRGDLIFTKKNYDMLSDLGNNLHLSVDFGFFGILAVPILRGLEFFYRYFPNYGVAIILLTLLIRLITFPLQYKSFKSMKKMQVIQPELAKLREKYKEDPQRMQKETMELFKRAGANPLGGCLPLLAQMPIFFAFYQVLYNAVELVGSPFIFWLTDLSIKDPYYVLPVLMGLSLVLQMKLNPTPTTDPMQKKIMMFMPIVFSFIMKDLPSGLNLYILVSTLFGIVQQMFVYKVTD